MGGGGFDDGHSETFVDGGHDEEAGGLVEGGGFGARDVVDVEDFFAGCDGVIEEGFGFFVVPRVAADEDEAVFGFEFLREELVGFD